jgi:hypothetical protein
VGSAVGIGIGLAVGKGVGSGALTHTAFAAEAKEETSQLCDTTCPSGQPQSTRAN